MKGLVPCAKIFVRKHSPTILTVLGTVGVIATGIFAAKETPKAMRKLKKEELRKGEPLTTKEKIVIATPVYVPTGVIAVSTIACIIGSNVINHQRQAQLMAAYTMARETLAQYRGEVVKRYGEDVDKEIMGDVIREYCNYHQIGATTPDKIFHFYEPISNQHFDMYERELMDAEYHINRNYVMRGYVTFNEWLEFVGLSPISNGDDIGWSIDSGMYWIDIHHRKTKEIMNGEPIYEVDYMYGPDEDALDEWRDASYVSVSGDYTIESFSRDARR